MSYLVMRVARFEIHQQVDISSSTLVIGPRHKGDRSQFTGRGFGWSLRQFSELSVSRTGEML